MEIPPTLEIFITHLLTNPDLVKSHKEVEKLLNDEELRPYRPFKICDVASDVDARNRWRQKCGKDRKLPAILCNGVWLGAIEQIIDAYVFSLDSLSQLMSIG